MIYFWDHFMFLLWNYFIVLFVTSPAPARPPAQDEPLGEDKDCIFLDADSHAESPTINFDSNDGTGARYNTPEARLRPHQPPSPVASGYSSQILTRRRNWERVVYFGPRSVVGSPTVNIRSARGSGTTFR